MYVGGVYLMNEYMQINKIEVLIVKLFLYEEKIEIEIKEYIYKPVERKVMMECGRRCGCGCGIIPLRLLLVVAAAVAAVLCY